MRKNVRFYRSAAAAQVAGFRACKRCRPDASPGSPEWNSRADVASRAMRLIADGLVDREGVPGLAAQLGYSVRQLERTLQSELGRRTDRHRESAARADGSDTHRDHNPTHDRCRVRRRILERSSVQRHGAVGLRNVAHGAEVAGPRTGPRELAASTAIDLRLPFRQPLCPDNLFGHLAATAVPGVEEVRNQTYRRTLRLSHGPGIVELTPTPDFINCRAVLSDMRDLTATIARSRWLLDLDADPVAIDRQLSVDDALAPADRQVTGSTRVPRCVDGAEMALRAILGQHISTAAARTHAGRLAQHTRRRGHRRGRRTESTLSPARGATRRGARDAVEATCLVQRTGRRAHQWSSGSRTGQ
jgi:AraC family transcriptional regulator of adaptative response / DNA-3-methyladenine glycosylase II